MDKQELKVTRKAYSSYVKFQAVMEVIKGKAVGEVARLYGFHPTLFPRWKRQFEEKGPGIFEDKKTDESQKKIEELTRMIGKKEIEKFKIQLLQHPLPLFDNQAKGNRRI